MLDLLKPQDKVRIRYQEEQRTRFDVASVR